MRLVYFRGGPYDQQVTPDYLDGPDVIRLPYLVLPPQSSDVSQAERQYAVYAKASVQPPGTDVMAFDFMDEKATVDR